MPLLEVNHSEDITATVTLSETTARLVDQYAAFISAPADEVVDKALNFVFSKDKEFQDFLKTSAAAQAPAGLRIRKVGKKETPRGSRSLQAEPAAAPSAPQSVSVGA